MSSTPHSGHVFRQLQEPGEPEHLYANLHAKRGKGKKIITFNLNLRLTKLETSKVIKILIFYTVSYIKKKTKKNSGRRMKHLNLKNNNKNLEQEIKKEIFISKTPVKWGWS